MHCLFITKRHQFLKIYGVTKNHKSRRFLVFTKLFENFTSPETMVFVVLGATLQGKKMLKELKLFILVLYCF